MEIRKQFKYEMAHIVRGAWTRRCSVNLHGHSYISEILIKGSTLDAGQMLIDFGLVKLWMNDFMDSFDHTIMLYNIEQDADLIELAIKKFERVIVSPFNTTAEMQAAFQAFVIKRLIDSHIKQNDEANGAIYPDAVKVRLHETTTGYAQAGSDEFFINYPHQVPFKVCTPVLLNEILEHKDIFWMSEGIASEWKNKDCWLESYNKII